MARSRSIWTPSHSCRLATSVPLPRFHTIHYAGVLAAASPWRSRLAPPLPSTAEDVEPEKRVRKSGYRPLG
jgi:hypothetical protein